MIKAPFTFHSDSPTAMTRDNLHVKMHNGIRNHEWVQRESDKMHAHFGQSAFYQNIVHYEMAKEIVQAFCIVLVSISCIHNYITNIRGLHLRKALENTSLCVEDGRTSSTNDGYKKLAFCS